MLLGIDVGNTNITLGAFDGEELLGTFRMTTKIARTSDEYGIFICDLLEHNGIEVSKVEAVIIASVVPDIMYSLNSAVIKYLKKEPIIVGPGIRTGIKIITENPRQIGADRIVDAVAAFELYGGPVIVIDFGTATTYDLVLEDGSYAAGVTAPGIQTAAQSAIYSCQRDDIQYAGRCGVWIYWTDRVHYPPDEERKRAGAGESRSDRRSG